MSEGGRYVAMFGDDSNLMRPARIYLESVGFKPTYYILGETKRVFDSLGYMHRDLTRLAVVQHTGEDLAFPRELVGKLLGIIPTLTIIGIVAGDIGAKEHLYPDEAILRLHSVLAQIPAVWV